jgi:zinc transporter
MEVRRLDGSGGAQTLTAADANAHAPGHGLEHGLLWVHLDFSDDADVQWLRDHGALPALVVDALVAEDTRPRVVVEGAGLLAILRGVNLNPGADPEDMVSVRLWVERGRIVSTRRRRLLSVADLVASLDAGRGPGTAAEFVAALSERLVWRMSDTVDALEDRIAELEARIMDGETASMRGTLAALRRQTITLRRYLAPERDALARLLGEKIDWLDEVSRRRIRETTDRLIRHVEDLDAVRERATVIHEELVGRMSEELNARMYLLAIISVVFLPLGFLTGLLGINVGGIPGAEAPHAFIAFSVLLIALVSVQILVMRWKRWF